MVPLSARSIVSADFLSFGTELLFLSPLLWTCIDGLSEKRLCALEKSS